MSPLGAQADIYVFCLLHNHERSPIDALDVSHWEFYVLPAAVSNERCAVQKTIRLAALVKLGPAKTSYAGIAGCISSLAGP